MNHPIYRLCAASVLVTLAGCAVDQSTESEPAAQTEQSILGGIPGNSKKIDAVGLLYGVRSTGALPICTGTLIGPHTVLTAGHCVRPPNAPFNLIDRYPVFFTIGYDSAKPSRTVRAIWAGQSPVAGNDVGIYQLAEDVNDVEPFKVADHVLGPENIEEKGTLIGFGLQNGSQNWDQFLTRRLASLSVTSFDSQPAHQLFPDYGRFKAFMESNAGHPFTDEVARAVYDNQILRPGDVFIGKPGQPQPVYLDSGAPYVRREGSDLVIYAIDSRGYLADPENPQPGLAANFLPIGGVAAMVAFEAVPQFIAQTQADPCRNLTSQGKCTAQTAVRCATEMSPPVISVVDCGVVGAVCKIDADGAAGCADP